LKKKNIIIISSIVAILLIVMGITAFLNAGNVAEKKSLEEEAVIQVSTAGNMIAEIDMDLVQGISPVDFSANLDTSDSGPREHIYTGVLLISILEELDINIKDYDTVIAKAIDGYTVAYEVVEVLDRDNIYLAIARDGEPLGSKNTGGSGPYQVIVRKDAFSQRWCKFVVGLELK
jgi:hypothetical protein